MGNKRWDANAWHRDHKRSASIGRKGRALAGVAILAAVALATGAVGVVQDKGKEKYDIGVCHATGLGNEPFVWLVVDREGFEHGHHRHHDGDFFLPVTSGGCTDVPLPAPTEPAEDNQTPEAPATNPTLPANETQPGNTTPVQEAPPAPKPGDVAARQRVSQDDFEVRLELTAVNVGAGQSRNVTMSDDLPDLRRPWLLAGTDSSACTLEGLRLRCEFGTLESGQSATVVVSAYTDRMPCGQHRTNTMNVAADLDEVLGNNASSGGIWARSC
jgi:hypothetical protein